MAKNKGLIPSSPGDISIQRKQLKAIIESLLPACTELDPIIGEPFRVQAIIANPPAYGHAHVAEALGVPLHIFFTMPWTPTYALPHPFARVPQSAGYWLSYNIVDLLIRLGIRGYINDFRNKLKLAPFAYFSIYHGSIYHLPMGYMWSPSVVPKPNDSNIPDNVFLLEDCPHDWLFPQCLAVVRAAVRRLVEEYKDEETSITIIGHSLGGALATLNAIDIILKRDNIPKDMPYKPCPVTVFAFASPRVVDQNFSSIISNEKHLHILRIINVGDIVPAMPPRRWGYTHVGNQLVVHIPGADLPRTVVCHRLKTYLNVIEEGDIDPHRDDDYK